ncbi:TPA: hypothetical protein DCW38_00395 [candidate division WOR-3 bacterium]|uniref:Outer membrane protein beta-barrel domain-containing protein n=1 Tax=candidate division WOR-3 bacterium TaxID=2052148 RepID=A0A350H7W9_UNCW3|nr:hypothetical protein [candidate division WOR-3 bacterium]
MKKFFLAILILTMSTVLFASTGGFIDFIATRPSNTVSYIGTFGLSIFLEMENLAGIENLSLRPKLTYGIGTGLIREDANESNIVYSVLIPDISLIYYIREFTEATKNGFVFYVGAGALMTFRFEHYYLDYFSDGIYYKYPYPALKFGLDINRKLLLELSISSPVMISIGLRF